MLSFWENQACQTVLHGFPPALARSFPVPGTSRTLSQSRPCHWAGAGGQGNTPCSRESSTSMENSSPWDSTDTMKSPRDFTALTTRMSTVMGNSDSLFRLFSSCGDKRRSVQSHHTEPQTGIREEENAALPESLLGGSKWLTSCCLTPKKLNTEASCKKLLSLPTRTHLKVL